MKFEKGWVMGRIRRTVYNMMTLSFLTWCALLACYFINRQNIDIQFLLFTASVIGIKRFIKNNSVISASLNERVGGKENDEDH